MSAPDLKELWPGQSVPLLKALHILTHNGGLNADSRRKLKQVQHLAQLIKPAIDAALKEKEQPVLADLGAGKSYLGFILYDLYFGPAGRGRVAAVEARADLIATAKKIAQDSGFDRMDFIEGRIADSALAPVDIVTALHACDTATDDAIAFGLQKKARAMVLVPCCQAEMAACLRQGKALQLARTPLAELWRHPLHTRELGSQVTNVLRCLYLEASGYQVTVTELVGWEHSMKNELIIARYTGQKKRSAADRLRAILQQFGLEEAMAARFGLGPAAAAPAALVGAPQS